MDETLDIAAFPAPPEGSTFRLRECKKISAPHPYMIGVGHVVHASDKFNGRLGVEAIESAERKGIHCQWRGCQLSYKEHTNDMTLIIEVDQNSDLNAVPGLHAYLVAIKAQAEALGVKGFAFPRRGQKL